MLSSGIFHDHVTHSHLQYDSCHFRSWFQEKWFTGLHLTLIWPSFDHLVVIYDHKNKWFDQTVNWWHLTVSLPRGYFFKMQIEQKFSYHDSSNSYPLEVTEIAVRSDSLFRSISLNYPNCGYYMVIMKSVNIIILLWKIV